ncbi:Bifunctional 23S rRNA (Guanine(2069)-N(7))-methyltransferase RlmK/23S rRNA (Guanine(2445)-N(2))-methyltransferase RlmL [Planctomycetales bacterium 10988]|nr:Bifunctional 23S rRNA (Guanine(2069)-N(7))-methyltransferase RlmK/23S rRNA (Guanine(2445)-N(2))-methyltransferase RlmL [Planctomycetales bacterium 10988]
MESLQLIATSAFGLEAVVSRELQSLGYVPQEVRNGRIFYETDLLGVCRSNLWLRSADRVLICLGQFEAPDFGVLFDETKALPWERWIPRNGSFPVRGRSHKSQLSSVPACQRMVKKAIVERLRAGHQVEELPEDGPLFPIEIALYENQATLTLDTSGPGLHKRGYRTYIGPAPLKETLASALIQLSFWKPGRPFWDPFCGSGTLAIEAALIGCNKAPGLERTFVAEEWPTFPHQLWQDAREEAQAEIVPSFEEPLIATDADERILRIARQHAEQAGVAHQIHFQAMPFQEISSKRQYGCLIANPPYGNRLGEKTEIEPLYQQHIPQVLRRFPTWSHFLLTAYPDFEKLIGQHASRRRKLYNGRLECTYYQFHGPKPGQKLSSERELAQQTPPSSPDVSENPTNSDQKPPSSETPSAIVRPAFGGITTKALEQAEIFRSRLKKRARHFRRWPAKQGITCFRLYDRDIPEVPLIVDRYDQCLHMAEYDRPHDRSVAEHADWLDRMKQTAAETLEVPLDRVFFKHRARQKGTQQYERVDEKSAIYLVQEGGLTFEVNLSDYLDTGLFLDHRTTRAMVRDEADGKRFLNLFCYTGAFSVYAAAGGAASTTSVDLSGTYLDWANRNLAHNGFTSSSHRTVCEDVLTFLEEDRSEYDLAVIDPPTFSNSKQLDEDWEIQHDYLPVLKLVSQRMPPGGVIYFSTNFRRFRFEEESLLPQLSGSWKCVEISRQTVPEDFRNRRIHRCWRLEKESERL